MKSVPKALTNLEALKPLEKLSSEFKELDNLPRILSAYELRQTEKRLPNKLRLPGNHKSSILIGRSLAKIGVDCEDIEAVESDHHGLHTLAEVHPFRKWLISYIHSNLIDSHKLLRSSTSYDMRTQDESLTRGSELNIPHNDSTTRDESERTIERYTQPRSSFRRKPKLPCYLLDASKNVEDFFGRGDIVGQIHDMLVVPDGTEVMKELKTFAISGIGGIGKSSIASHFVQTRKNKFDAIFWLNADTAGKLADSFGKMAVQLELQERGEDRDKVMSRSLVLDWLADPIKVGGAWQSRARWLLVFDNVDDFELMKDFWPPRGAGSVLLTSRDPLARLATQYYKEHSQSTKDLLLPPLTDDEATKFLLRQVRPTKSNRNNKAAEDLARRLQGLPLALRQLAGIMKRRHLSLEELLEMYNDVPEHKDIHQTVGIEASDNYRHNLATVWGLEKLESKAKMLMNVLSFYDPDHIQEEILYEGSEQVKANDYPKGKSQYWKAREGLWKHSLVMLEGDLEDENEEVRSGNNPGNGGSSTTPNALTQNRAGTPKLDFVGEPRTEVEKEQVSQLSVHRVVQDAARAKMDERELGETFEAVVTLLLTRWRRKERLWHYDREDWPRADHLYPHVTQVYHHYRAMKPHQQKVLASKDLVRLLDCAGWSEESKAIFTTAFETCKEHLDSDEVLMLEIHTSLGCIATEINDPITCFEHYKRLLEMTEEKHQQPKSQEDFDALMVAKNEMGIAHMMISHIHEAWELFDDAREIARARLERSETARSIFFLSSANLGLAQWLEPQLDKAFSTLIEAWRMLNNDDRAGFAPGRLAHALGNVSESLNEEGSTDDANSALDWYTKAYEHYRRTIGLYHHRTADVCHKLAGQYIRLKQFEHAQ
ncbi:hypothetical protein N0V90_004863 [Kalmusia sp. IMI 367209]|nr:hypothetical protein N0V90_004863 [Kalmusia sp. IMI 367209]